MVKEEAGQVGEIELDQNKGNFAAQKAHIDLHSQMSLPSLSIWFCPVILVFLHWPPSLFWTHPSHQC